MPRTGINTPTRRVEHIEIPEKDISENCYAMKVHGFSNTVFTNCNNSQTIVLWLSCYFA